MSYETEIASTDSFKPNVIIRIDSGTYYGIHQPDSGLTVAAAARIVQKVEVSPQVISVEDAKTTFASLNFVLSDKSNVVTGLLNGADNNFIGKKVECWLGRITGSFAWADYHKLTDTYITGWDFSKEAFKFTSSDFALTFQKPVYDTVCKLASDTSAGAATLVASTSIADFPASGRLFIDDEAIAYSAKVDGTKTFTLTGTTANDHSAGADVYNSVSITGNPIDIFMRVLQSTGGGTYDDYVEGLGLTDAQVDVTAIEAIRDAYFSGESFTFELYGIEKIIDWIETEILKPCSCRIVQSEGGKLSLAVLDQSTFGTTAKTFDSSNIINGSVSYRVSGQKVRNVVTVRYGWSTALQEFTREYTSSDTDSMTVYGEKQPYIVEAKGIPATGAGDLIAIDRADRWLARLKNANPEIELETFFSESLAVIGERVLLTYDLPSTAGNRAFSNELEVVKRGYDVLTGKVKFSLAFTNYSGTREGFISPAPLCIAGGVTRYRFSGDLRESFLLNDVIRFVSPGGTQEGPGYISAVVYDAGGPHTEFSLSGASFTGIASATGFRLQYGNYDDTVGALSLTTRQKRYGYAGIGASNFADGTSPYKITF